MLKQIHLALLAGLMALLPVVGVAQTCKPESIPASTPTGRFTDHADGTVTDNQTGLMWKKCSEGQTWNSATNGCDGSAALYTWKAALERAQAVNGGGSTGWRVPNIKELNSIVEVQCAEPAINLAVFPNTPSGAFWTSSPDSYAPHALGFFDGSEGMIELPDGRSVPIHEVSDALQVRLVRDDVCTPGMPGCGA